jgi:hypothetical protein
MRGSGVAVCSNCGGNDFVWAENLKTGGIGRGGLSLRSGGELAIGTRVCRGCGHADLFVKDPTVLRQPHTWRPGEFVPIPPRTPAPARPASPSAPPTSPGSSGGVAPGPPMPPTAPAPTPVSSGTPAPSSPGPAPRLAAPGPSSLSTPPPTTEPAPATDVSTAQSPEGAAKKPTRRKGSRSKAANPPVIHE